MPVASSHSGGRRPAWESGESGESSVCVLPGDGQPHLPCVCPGEDADLCSELLQESLDALRALPEASLFDESTVSSVWLEVVERATRFLRSVVTG